MQLLHVSTCMLMKRVLCKSKTSLKETLINILACTFESAAQADINKLADDFEEQLRPSREKLEVTQSHISTVTRLLSPITLLLMFHTFPSCMLVTMSVNSKGFDCDNESIYAMPCCQDLTWHDLVLTK